MMTRMSLAAKRASCLICDEHNDIRAALCANCCAPMALSTDVNGHHEQASIITVLGQSNVGKTVYLGLLLDALSKRAADFRAVPQGTYSVNLQESVVSHLQNRLFPPKTPCEPDQWNWAYYRISRRGKRAGWHDLVMPDMAGEALAAEIEMPTVYDTIQRLLSRSAACLLLVDAGVALSSSQPDLFALKLMTYLDGALGVNRGKRIPNPVAVVLCKADYCPQCFDDPCIFARTNLNRLWNFCETRCANVEFFAASVVGSLGFGTDGQNNGVVIPLHTAPRGLVEPLEWVLRRLR